MKKFRSRRQYFRVCDYYICGLRDERQTLDRKNCTKWEMQKPCVRARRSLRVCTKANAIINPRKSELIQRGIWETVVKDDISRM